MEKEERPVRYVDVLIVGGGPVGLTLALSLYSSPSPNPPSLLVLDKAPKDTHQPYGRAITLYPRTSEMLSQLSPSLTDSLCQSCFACRTTVSYSASGHEVKGRGWSFMERMGRSTWTQYDFALVLRQMYQEEILRAELASVGGALEGEKEVIGLTIYDEVKGEEGYKGQAIVKDLQTGLEEIVRWKYLVGADGGHSFVRRELGIPFQGETSEDRWVRIDGLVETDMPKSRGYGAIESPTHGNVLWAALDRGATRIGFAFTKARQEKYEVFDEAAAVVEAIESVKPFKLKFNRVDWFTVYSVGQRVAKEFFVKGCVFLVGDACHTHSSGAAQGMNTGIHDAVNLGWKLRMVLNGQAHPSLLNTYQSERLPNVQKLINYDKDISRLMTMQLPSHWKGDPNIDPNELLGTVMAEASEFTSGLSIALEPNHLNITGSWKPKQNSTIGPGKRAPDSYLQKPGTFEPTRLHKETPNKARFHILVFAGDPEYTAPTLKRFSNAKEASKVFARSELPVSWLTIPARKGPSAFELLGIMPLGKVFYDEEKSAHERYGVDVKEGAVFLLRPDGWIGTATNLNADGVEELEVYFEKILLL